MLLGFHAGEEGPLLAIKSVNGLSHYTDWTIAHVHAGALGWNGFMTFGMMYWLLPRLFQTELYSTRLANLHFWLGTVGILLYIFPIYVAGLTQGLMWRAITDTGQLAYPNFVETVRVLIPLYLIRAVGGVVYLSGALLLSYNFFQTWKRRRCRSFRGWAIGSPCGWTTTTTIGTPTTQAMPASF